MLRLMSKVLGKLCPPISLNKRMSTNLAVHRRLNFKDIMVAMGQLPQPALGIDCSGIVTRVGTAVQKVQQGDRVMTWRMGTFCNFARSPECMVHRIPDSLDFVAAASFPVVYNTAHYALSHAARLLPRETILIHGAAGGVYSVWFA